MPQRFHNILFCGFFGGGVSEDDADDGGDGEGDEDAERADDGQDVGCVLDDEREGDAQQDADDTSEDGY